MSKSIEDYRNIVKILKLQLLKVREENNALSHEMGIVSESETSSFTPKLNKYKQSDETFAKKVTLFLEFAHRCELIGISPEMVFRIGDKKRDKSVSVRNLSEIIQRLKIRMSDDSIDKMLNTISNREKEIQYERYLQCLSAFQINSEKFPFQSSRTFVQLCIIQFAKICKQLYPRPRQLFNDISSSSSSEIYITYDKFVNFCNKKCQELKETQIVAIFLGLDIQSLCKIEREIFEREIQKIYSLIDRGMADDKSFVRDSPKKSKSKKPEINEMDEQFAQSDNEGDQKLNKKKVQPTKVKQKQKKLSIPQSAVKLDQKILNDIQKLLKVKGFEFIDLVGKLLQKERDKKDVYLRSFSLGDISEALIKLTDKFKRKEIIDIFRKLDINSNGSTSSEQLIKLMIRVGNQKLMASLPKLRALLYRHFKETQFPNPTLKFTSLGYKVTDKVTEQQLRLVFDKLNLSEDEMNFMFPILLRDGTITVEKFCAELQKDPSSSRKKEFNKMPNQVQKELTQLLNGIKTKQGKKESSNFKKLNRLEDLKAAGESQIWATIFQNEWDCFEYCLQSASKLETFWRDPEFGPTKGDPHGLRSIIGNESERPPGLPDDDDILWLTFDQIMVKRQVSDEEIFMRRDLKSTDIVQGMLGDCWYVSALSIITQNDEYVKGSKLQKLTPQQITSGICPPLFHYFTNYGMYVFKFFKKFKPVYVIVDDLFPIQSSSNTLIFAHSPEINLQWVAFAEKAYAKLHHTYSNMISGDIAQGLNDLTNSIPLKQVLNLGKEENIEKVRSLADQKQLMGCSIKQAKDDTKVSSSFESPFYYEDERCGLLAGHAYSIIDYIDLQTSKQKFQLIRVRNPHGHTEWILDWSDNPLNNNEDYKKLKLYQKDLDKYYEQKIQSARKNDEQEPIPYRPGEDGEFLMNVVDWNNIFNNLFIGLNQGCKQFQDGLIYQTIDAWGGKKPSGVCKSKGASDQDLKNFIRNNHQYIMQIKQTTNVLMLLSQQDGRLYRGEKYPYKELVCSSIILVFKLDGNEKQLAMYKKDKLVDPNRPLTLEARRDIDYWTTYTPGRYAILPVRKEKDEKINEFEFRLFVDKKIKITKIGSNETFSEQKISSTLGRTTSEILQKDSAQKVINFLKKNNPKFDKQ